MAKMKLDFKEKHHVLEVDGVGYEIPQRTPALDAKIREHDDLTRDMTEYDGNMHLLEVIFGKKAAKQMFPKKDETNLDKLALCARYALKLFMKEYEEAKNAEMASQVSLIKPLLDRVEELKGAIDEMKAAKDDAE